MTSLLEVNALNVSFELAQGTVNAVAGIDFVIHRGETFCLVGESGSGKSVTALALMGLLPRRGVTCRGSACLHTTDQSGQSRVETLVGSDCNGAVGSRHGRRMAMVFQEPMTSLNPVMTIGEQLLEVLALHQPQIPPSAWRETVVAALREVQLPYPERRIDDYPHRLSGGQRQRVMIAMAMACQSDLLIADEPTTALDVTVQAEILRLLKSLQARSGMGILLITHDFGVVAAMAHRVGVMRAGKLVEQGDVASILKRPGADYTRRLLAALPDNLPRQVRQGETTQQVATVMEVVGLKVHFPVHKGVLRRVVDHIKAVDGVDLCLRRGQVLALVGESGCGKTTLARAILRLVPPTGGEIWFGGEDLSRLGPGRLRLLRRRLQVVFQDPVSALNPRLRVYTALVEPQRVHGIGVTDQERLIQARYVLDQVRLPADYLWRYPHELSGGERQRVGIARALVLAPEVLVCDEITSALDVSIQAELLQLLLELKRERNLTLLFITHDIGVVEYVSDDTAVMYQGQIVERGTTAQVCGQPRHAYTQRLLAAVPRVHALVTAMP